MVRGAARCLGIVGLFVGLLGPARAVGLHELPETCYLFAYFYHDQEAHGLRLAWSADGYKFEAIHHGASFLKPTVGESKLMRDPTIARGPDGTFHLVWTTSWDGKTIGYASSQDLINWSPQQAIPVMAHEPEAQNCWAPEILWDEAKQHFLIYWSTTILGKFRETENTNRRPQRNHRIYATTTKDFVTYTPTRLHYDGGYNVIDAMITPNGPNDWLMFVKNEQLTPRTEKNIRLVRGPSPDGPWGEASPRITGDYWAEGPAALKVGDEWRVYFDKHMLNAIGLVVSRDLQTWEDVSDRLTFPKDARHPSVIPVPRAVIASLRNAPSPSAQVARGEFNVLDFGVVPDGVTKNTQAIARAIAAVKDAGGGTLRFPPGKYLTGSIHLESNLTLHLEAGAELLYSGDPGDSPLVESRWEGTTAWTYGPLLYANRKENIAITGRGTINGQGQNWWWRASDTTPRRDIAEKARPVWVALRDRIQNGDGANVKKEDFVEAANFIRPSLVVPYECRNILIEGVTITNSPMWLLHTIYSENITVRGVSFISHGPNGDGYDIDSCRNVRISDCYFDTGDDCIVIKSGRDADGRRVNRPTELVTITNCVMYRGHGAVVIGSEMSGGIRDITASNIVTRGTDRGIRLKTQRGRGAVVENLRFDNWVIIDAPREAIHITSNYSNLPAELKSERTPTYRNIAISNITVVNARTVVGIAGLPEQAVEQVRISDLRGTGQTGFVCDAADDLELHDIRIDAKEGPAFTFTNSHRLLLDNLATTDRQPWAQMVQLENITDVTVVGQEGAK